MRGFWYDTEDCDEDSSAGDEEGANEHPWREDVAEDESREEGVPKQGHRAERGEDDHWERGDLEDRAEEVGRDEDSCNEPCEYERDVRLVG